MYLNSKKIPLLLLGITSLTCSRILFSLFNDPEGPNLLIVMGLAAILYVLSFAVYWFVPSMKGFKRVLLAILIQIVIVFVLYFSLN